jgi:hypothetical protein
LPLGEHAVDLILVPPPPDPFSNTTLAPVQITAVILNSGMIATASTRNVTIDDTAWRNETITLSPGWNMLESERQGAVSNWLNSTQMEAERANRARFYNESLSWTEQRRASTTVRFDGEAAWVYGLGGGAAGRYEVVLDSVTKGVFDAAGGARV